MFMHKGQIGGYRTIRRRIEALVPDELYNLRTGTTDTEAILLAAASRRLEADPVAAISATHSLVPEQMRRAGVTAALRFTAALTDRDGIWAFRWVGDAAPPTLYFRQDETGVIVVSEPIDDDREDWQAVPPGHALAATHGTIGAVRLGETSLPVPGARRAGLWHAARS
jgi:predicted glutamine amidotransferase